MVRAFPNAYIETDVPPRRTLDSALALLGAAGPLYFGFTILVLSFLDGEFSPISQAASDYGVGHFAAMNIGFFVGGVGLIAFALALQRSGKSRLGSAVFFVGGLVLLMNSIFTTDLEGGPTTLHGTIHNFGGLIFFTTTPLGSLLLSRKFGRIALLADVAGLIVGFGLLVANVNAAGLGERAILLVVFSCVILSALKLRASQ